MDESSLKLQINDLILTMEALVFIVHRSINVRIEEL